MNKLKEIILNLISFQIIFLLNESVAVLVETNQGVVRGIPANNGDYSMFLGIPYGVVDINNPFSPSTTYPVFDTIFDANDDSIVCPQEDNISKELIGVVDCLHLNVYVPNNASTSSLPVLVWIHGGSFEYGHGGRSLHAPQFLVRHDVIVVGINYRLGPYGFMCLDIPEVPGNTGLKDQLLALRWVKNNIQHFGGDPDQITIFGESAGSTSVDYHMHYSAKENLFHRAILQSGNTLGHQARNYAERRAPFILAEYLGFQTEDIWEALSFLSFSNPTAVVEAFKVTSPVLKPCIEMEFSSSERFIHEFGLNLDVPSVQNIPVIMGFNNDESLMGFINKDQAFFDELDVVRDTLDINFEFDATEMNEMETLVKHFYFGDEEFSDEIKFELSDFRGDITYLSPMTRSIEKYLENGAIKIYHYMFSYSGSRNFVKFRNNVTIGGAVHADELGYLFDYDGSPVPIIPEDQKVIDQITTLWTNFVKYGNPTPSVSELLPLIWEPVTREKMNYLNIDSQLSLDQRPYHSRMAFWKMFYKLNEKKQRFYANHSYKTTLNIIFIILVFVNIST